MKQNLSNFNYSNDNISSFLKTFSFGMAIYIIIITIINVSKTNNNNNNLYILFII